MHRFGRRANVWLRRVNPADLHDARKQAPVVAKPSEVKSRRTPALLSGLFAGLLVDLESEPAGLALGINLGLVGTNLAALHRLRGRAGERRRLAEYIVALLALGTLSLTREDLLVGADGEQVIAPAAVLDDALLRELGR